MKRRVFVATLAAAAFAASNEARSELSPVAQPSLPLPSWVRSARVERHDFPIEAIPHAKGERRGSAILGARLPVFGAKPGPGCNGKWLNVGKLAWICQDVVTLTPEPPLDPADRSGLTTPTGLPYQYFFVGKEGSWAYASLREADEGVPERQLEPGFAIAVVEQQKKGNDRYARTSHGLWVPMRDLSGPVRPFAFQGESVQNGQLDFGWILEDKAPIFDKPAASSRKKETRARYDRVAILEERPVGKETWLRIGEDEWVRARSLRRPTLAAPPEEVQPNERWIDVELASQTLVAYEGTTPVFATLVSTGRGGQGTPQATPKGVHRIWVKLRSTDMSNLADTEAEHLYAIEDVPFVQFFSKGVGLHAAFWHRSFGQVRSQGCVNLAPLDAQMLFEFTGPHLPAGWHAVLPTAEERGTVVRVR